MEAAASGGRLQGRGVEFTGNTSLLKSALQKNVRQGRPDQAVRLTFPVCMSPVCELPRSWCRSSQLQCFSAEFGVAQACIMRISELFF
jgi:hypothetical protein